jgi:hypothetical protein
VSSDVKLVSNSARITPDSQIDVFKKIIAPTIVCVHEYFK